MSRPHTHAGTRLVANGSHQPIKIGHASPEVIRAVRQLVSVAVSYLNSHPACSCEEAMAQLPANDNFHR